MHHDSSTLPGRLRDALERMTPDQPNAVERLRELYSDDMVFRDPVQQLRGIDAFVAMNGRFLRRLRSLQWAVHTVAGDDRQIFLEWTMHGKAKLGPDVRVEGLTRARARDGRIFDHRDYWDLGELMANTIPGGQRILHAMLSPFA